MEVRGELAWTKEEVVNKEIVPLIDQLYEACRKHRVPMIVDVVYAEDSQGYHVRGGQIVSDDKELSLRHWMHGVLAQEAGEGTSMLGLMVALGHASFLERVKEMQEEGAIPRKGDRKH